MNRIMRIPVRIAKPIRMMNRSIIILSSKHLRSWFICQVLASIPPRRSHKGKIKLTRANIKRKCVDNGAGTRHVAMATSANLPMESMNYLRKRSTILITSPKTVLLIMKQVSVLMESDANSFMTKEKSKKSTIRLTIKSYWLSQN